MSRTTRTILWCLPVIAFVTYMAALMGFPLPYFAFAALGLLP